MGRFSLLNEITVFLRDLQQFCAMQNDQNLLVEGDSTTLLGNNSGENYVETLNDFRFGNNRMYERTVGTCRRVSTRDGTLLNGGLVQQSELLSGRRRLESWRNLSTV